VRYHEEMRAIGLKTFLVCDDDVYTRALLRATLEGFANEVIEATDGEAALALARQRQPDLVLMDLQMPVMDGLEACRRLKADDATAHIPVVMLTGCREETDRERGEQVGVAEYLTKPFSPLQLLNLVSRLAGDEGETDPARFLPRVGLRPPRQPV